MLAADTIEKEDFIIDCCNKFRVRVAPNREYFIEFRSGHSCR